MTGLSLYIIKPEAISFCKEIREIIVSQHLKIENSKQLILHPGVIENIYIDCSEEIVKATKHFICNQISEVGIVSGDGAVEKLFAICGEKTNPFLCEDGTIRKLFGIKEPQYFNGTYYYRNAIHRPKTNDEAEKNILLFDVILNK